MAGGQQPQSSDSTGSGVLWAIAGLGGIILFFWFAFKTELISFYYAIKLFEINFLSHFNIDLSSARYIIESYNPKEIKFDDAVTVGGAVGAYLRFPFALLLGVLALWVYFANSVRIYKREYSMRDLLQLEKGNWPQVSPVAKLDLIKTDIDKGPWAMAMTPMQFCKRNNLLDEYKRISSDAQLSKERDKIEVALKRGQANKIFAMQLGPLWAGPDKLSDHAKALYALFAARLNGDSQIAADLFRQLSLGASEGKMNYAGIDALLKKHRDTKLVQKAIAPHAYVYTVMASMLEHARQDGVQATADFLWLKPLDRRLWYVLNTVGRQTPFVEIAGVFAHWISEKELGKRILVPMVDEATNALELALKEILYRREED